LLTALQRLERAGLLNTEWQQIENSGPEQIYFLTLSGKDQLDAEWTHRSSALARFFDDSTLDDSFRKFLNRNT
jgi:PadR family transcriptional regulator, regulatory protein PadR